MSRTCESGVDGGGDGTTGVKRERVGPTITLQAPSIRRQTVALLRGRRQGLEIAFAGREFGEAL